MGIFETFSGQFLGQFFKPIYFAVFIQLAKESEYPRLVFFSGVQYDEPTECALPAPHVLKVLGGVGIVFGLLVMCAAPCGQGAMGVVYGISRFVKLILQIWASVLIFGKYFFLSKIPQYFKAKGSSRRSPFM